MVKIEDPLLVLKSFNPSFCLLLHQATISFYQLMHMQTVALPVHYQTLCESSKLYDPGQQYGAHVRDLQLPEQPNVHYTFEAYCPSSTSTQ